MNNYERKPMVSADTLQQAIEDARARYVTANPLSFAADKDAERYLPGGNTRTVLHYDPFPLTMVSGEGAELVDLDGHRYVDCVGEFSAGLFGHSDPLIKSAIHQALDTGIAMGAPTANERNLAKILCERFPSIERIRFCNSGTEANIMALSTARVVTGREKILAFHGAYHGGVINFPNGGSPLNIPFDIVLGDYNDIEGTAKLIREQGAEFAAVIVEPILGAGGNIPGNKKFLQMLRRMASEVGALLILDEVKTARIGPSGMQGRLNISPDLTTLGKIIGGGMPTGAFGGKAEIMDHYNPKQKDGWKHAGTFNNNACSMAAGCAAMGQVFTEPRAKEFQHLSETFRLSLNNMFADKNVPMYCNGLGSIFAIHFTDKPIRRVSDISIQGRALGPLLHMELLLDGVLLCSRGDIFLSLPMNESHFSKVYHALEKFVDRYTVLIVRQLDPG